MERLAIYSESKAAYWTDDYEDLGSMIHTLTKYKFSHKETMDGISDRGRDIIRVDYWKDDDI